MTYREAYEKHAEKFSQVEGDAIDTQVTDIRDSLQAGRFNRAFLAGVHDDLGRDLNREVELPHGKFPQVMLRAARRYAAIHEILAFSGGEQ